ncbi:MAG: DNA polymerase III subunit delta [Flavobacteriales bacterium]
MKFEQIISSLKKKDYQPIYFLMGDEPYYIDYISDFIIKNILNDSEKDFNQHIFYAKDSDVNTIISTAKQFPLMSNYTVVVIKEAQDLKKIELFEEYFNNPLSTTILVFCYKNKSIDKRKKFGKNISKKALVFESKKLYENQIPDWIQKFTQQNGYQISIKASYLLNEFLGNNLSKLSNELEKLMIICDKDKEISTDLIEKNIGISKDYNVFELNNALSIRDHLKANRIVNYFENNPKTNPLILTISSLFNHFQKTLIYHTLKDKSKNNVASKLKINPFFVKDYSISAKNYSKKQLMNIISNLRIYDLKSKGVDNQNTTDGQLLRELIFKILH